MRGEYFLDEKGQSMFNRRSNDVGSMAFIGLIILVVIVGLVGSIKNAMTFNEYNARILNAEIKQIGTGDKAEDVYLISIQPVRNVGGEWVNSNVVETVKVEDSLAFGRFRSADVYFELKNNIGAIYYLKTQGIRNGYFSMFPNIIEHRKL